MGPRGTGLSPVRTPKETWPTDLLLVPGDDIVQPGPPSLHQIHFSG